MSRYKYVFLDMDGTMGNTQQGIFNCTKYAFKKLGAEIDESYKSLRRVIGPPLVWAYQEFFGLNEEDAVKATAYYRERYSEVGIFEMELYDGVEKYLKTMYDDGIVLAVVSAKPYEYVDRIISHFGIDKYFSCNSSASKSDVDHSKVRLIKKAVEQLGIEDLNQVVMVGDTPYDLDAASDVGIDGIGVTYGFGSENEIKACKSVYVATSFKDVYEFINGEHYEK